MKPAASIILFSTLAGMAQGLVVLCVALVWLVERPAPLALLLWAATGLTVLALGASFFHLGQPLRAWRAVLMWRTSWMSREVIVLPAFMAVTGLWALAASGAPLPAAAQAALPVLALLLALALWWCTAMIYACLRFVQEWAHPVTIANYTLIGLASGLVAGCALTALAGQAALALAMAPWAVAATALAWAVRAWSLRRNAALKPRSTAQTATGIRATRVVQTSMGLTGGSFNTREFFHGATQQLMRGMRTWFQVLGFGAPAALLLLALATGSATLGALALPLQFTGLLMERWFFFAQARHPQNIYYQVVS